MFLVAALDLLAGHGQCQGIGLRRVASLSRGRLNAGPLRRHVVEPKTRRILVAIDLEAEREFHGIAGLLHLEQHAGAVLDLLQNGFPQRLGNVRELPVTGIAAVCVVDVVFYTVGPEDFLIAVDVKRQRNRTGHRHGRAVGDRARHRVARQQRVVRVFDVKFYLFTHRFFLLRVFMFRY